MAVLKTINSIITTPPFRRELKRKGWKIYNSNDEFIKQTGESLGLTDSPVLVSPLGNLYWLPAYCVVNENKQRVIWQLVK